LLDQDAQGSRINMLSAQQLQQNEQRDNLPPTPISQHRGRGVRVVFRDNLSPKLYIIGIVTLLSKE